MTTSVVFPAFAALVAAAFLLIVPKERYKHYLLWGLIFGALGDAIIVASLSALNLIEYRNLGPFGLFGAINFWTPLTWGLMFSLFFYLLPVRKAFLVPYILAFVALTYSVGLVMESLGAFRYIGIQRILAIPLFLVWYTVSAWAYLRSERVELR